MPKTSTNPTQLTSPSNPRLGRCYELAGIFTLESFFTSEGQGPSLVHGSIEGFGAPRLKHAWVEFPDGAVWEPATDKMWPKVAFERIFNPVVDIKYDARAMSENIERFQHWGPWDQTPPQSLG